MDALPIELRWAQAIALVIIPPVAAWIAAGQWRTARDKLKLDLFDRRLQLYQLAHGFIGSVVIGGAANADIDDYARKILDAEFLLTKDIASYLDEIRTKANSLRANEKESASAKDAATRNVAIARASKGSEWFQAQFVVLKDHFLPLIGFERQRFDPVGDWIDRTFRSRRRRSTSP